MHICFHIYITECGEGGHVTFFKQDLNTKNKQNLNKNKYFAHSSSTKIFHILYKNVTVTASKYFYIIDLILEI